MKDSRKSNLAPLPDGIQIIIHEGWLHKKSNRMFRTMQERFFQLVRTNVDGNSTFTLRYFEEFISAEEQKEPLGVAVIQDARCRAEITLGRSGKGEDNDTTNIGRFKFADSRLRFVVESYQANKERHRKFFLCARTVAERDEWVEALENSLQPCEPEPRSSGYDSSQIDSMVTQQAATDRAMSRGLGVIFAVVASVKWRNRAKKRDRLASLQPSSSAGRGRASSFGRKSQAPIIPVDYSKPLLAQEEGDLRKKLGVALESFRCASSHIQAQVMGQVGRVVLKPGQMLTREFCVSDRCYVVAKGKMEIAVTLQPTASRKRSTSSAGMGAMPSRRESRSASQSGGRPVRPSLFGLDVLCTFALLQSDYRCESSYRASRAGYVELWVLERSRYQHALVVGNRARNALCLATISQESALKSVDISNAQLAQVVNAMGQQSFEPGAEIRTRGAAEETYFIVVEGRVELRGTEGSSEPDSTLEPGGCFGHAALSQDKPGPAAAQVTASEKVEVAYISHTDLWELLGDRRWQLQEDQAPRAQALRTVPALQMLTEDETKGVVSHMATRYYKEGDVIARDGEPVDYLFVLEDGLVDLELPSKKGAVASVPKKLAPGTVFGYESLFTEAGKGQTASLLRSRSRARSASRSMLTGTYVGTLTARSEVKCAAVSFGATMETGAGDRKRIAAVILAAWFRFSVMSSRKEEEAPDYSTLSIDALKGAVGHPTVTLGAGSFGRVRLVNTEDGKKFALKCMRKSVIEETRQEGHTVMEKQALEAFQQNRYVVRLYKTFQNPVYVFMLFELLTGGDLYQLMLKQASHRSERAFLLTRRGRTIKRRLQRHPCFTSP
ncbi:hypothetical protein CYMTET_35340 [Cymbomonas tetramitiformis]|uniref:cGMP-dependent protein kinase n=1 Tax=Cymbomonas tetramitiformis TaxID=36881 RepID=A0AAE0F9D7_9CHLO|nr:hypothetical protein CYMTET_35340 [Cymbomonas tetramitiformis]